MLSQQIITKRLCLFQHFNKRFLSKYTNDIPKPLKKMLQKEERNFNLFKRGQTAETKSTFQPGKSKKINAMTIKRAQYLSDYLYPHVIQIAQLELDPNPSVAISKVEIQPDFSYTKIFWVPSGCEETDNEQEVILNKCAGILRSKIITEQILPNLPPIKFQRDESLGRFMKVSRLLEKINEENQKHQEKYNTEEELNSDNDNQQIEDFDDQGRELHPYEQESKAQRRVNNKDEKEICHYKNGYNESKIGSFGGGHAASYLNNKENNLKLECRSSFYDSVEYKSNIDNPSSVNHSSINFHKKFHESVNSMQQEVDPNCNESVKEKESKFIEKDDVRSKFRQDIFGLDHSAMMNKLVASTRKTNHSRGQAASDGLEVKVAEFTKTKKLVPIVKGKSKKQIRRENKMQGVFDIDAN